MPPPPHHSPAWTPPTAETADLGDGEVHFWRVPLDLGRAPGLVDRRRELLSPDEHERAARYRFPEGAGQFILCRAAVRMLLGRYTGTPPEAVRFQYGANGKPTLAARDGDTRSPPLEFSVSHSGAHALLGFARRHPLGVDIERFRDMPDADNLVERFFSPAEQDEYRTLPPDQRLLGFFHGWTRKEAFVKALGDGLSRPLDSFDVTLAPDHPARLRRIATLPDEESIPDPESRWSLLSFQPAPGYLAAAAVEASGLKVSFLEFDDGQPPSS